jgi:Domain of unknown function (DUF4112)
MENEQKNELWLLDKLADFLDNRFRIPFTKIRFGFDALIGVIPYAGDALTFMVSGVMVLMMVRKGASGMLAVKMVGNVALDAAIGIIPLLGDLLDIRYKANYRNVQLMKQHYVEGKHGGSAWWVLFLLLAVVVGILALSIYLTGKVLIWVFG